MQIYDYFCIKKEIYTMILLYSRIYRFSVFIFCCKSSIRSQFCFTLSTLSACSFTGFSYFSTCLRTISMLSLFWNCHSTPCHQYSVVPCGTSSSWISASLNISIFLLLLQKTIKKGYNYGIRNSSFPCVDR